MPSDDDTEALSAELEEMLAKLHLLATHPERERFIRRLREITEQVRLHLEIRAESIRHGQIGETHRDASLDR